MYKKILIFSTILFILSGLAVLAEETDSETGETTISAEDLGVEEPNWLSWFNDAFDTAQIWLARDPIKKSELELRKVSRQVIRIREMVQNNLDNVELQAKLERTTSRYEEMVSNMNQRIEELKAEEVGATKLKNFLDKYTDQQLKHQEILQKLEEQVPAEVMEMIQEKRQAHLEKFGQVMEQLQNREEITERLGSALEDAQQRIEHQVRKMEIIEELEEVTGTEVKEAISGLKEEKKELFQILQEKQQEMIRERQELREQIGESVNETKEQKGFMENIKKAFRSGKED